MPKPPGSTNATAFEMAQAILGGIGRVLNARAGGADAAGGERVALTPDPTNDADSHLDMEFVPEGDAIALDLPGALSREGLLGMTALGRLRVTVDGESKIMTLQSR